MDVFTLWFAIGAIVFLIFKLILRKSDKENCDDE